MENDSKKKHIKEKNKKYWEANKARLKKKRAAPGEKEKRSIKYKTKYYARYKENFKNKQKVYRENLAEPYVKRVFINRNKNIKAADISDKLIAAKQAIMMLKRGVRLAQKKREYST